jgi:hypothetical protein
MNGAPGPHYEIRHDRPTRSGGAGGAGRWRRGMARRGLGEPGWREPGLGRTGLWVLPVRPVKMLGWHAYKV